MIPTRVAEALGVDAIAAATAANRARPAIQMPPVGILAKPHVLAWSHGDAAEGYAVLFAMGAHELLL